MKKCTICGRSFACTDTRLNCYVSGCHGLLLPAERSGVLQGCLPSANCSAEAGAEARQDSLISSPVPPKEAIPAAPEIRDIVEAIRQEDLRHSMPVLTDDTYTALAWKRWARALPGKTIADTIMLVCANCIRPGTKLEAQFLEAYMRLKNTKRRTLPAQRERAIRRNR